MFLPVRPCNRIVLLCLSAFVKIVKIIETEVLDGSYFMCNGTGGLSPCVIFLQPGCRASAIPLPWNLNDRVMRKDSGHLPFFGIGPLYVALVCGLTAAGVWASSSGLLESGIVPSLKVPMRVAGVLVIVAGLFIWLCALLGSRIDDGIRNNRLVTDGIYAWCRNPLYTGWMFMAIGVAMLWYNLWLMLLPLVFWWLMGFMMRRTEEKWLRRLYGAEYDAYCRRVNRVWPWFPKR